MKIFTRFLLLSLAAFAVVQSKAQTTSTTTSDFPYLNNGIPTLYVNTDTQVDPPDRDNYVKCTVRYVDGSTTTTYNLTTDGIKGRGNSTWSADKKPWRLKFDDKVAFLGSDYAKAKSWTLLANTYDKSLMRNALTYYLGKFVGLPFCPSARFVDLVMNGTYRGTYQISDQMEVNKKRVNINSDTGWMFEYANASDKVDDPKITTRYGWVQIKNPDDKVLTSATTTDMTNYLNSLDDSISTSTTGYTYIDPNTGYRRMVDATTLINWYIATEITANWDGFYSVYSYRDPNGPLCLGPMWDEDLAYGNHTETYNTSYFPNGDFYDKLLAENNFNQELYPNGYRKLQPVIAHLYDDPWFANAVYMRFNELVNNGIEKNLLDNIESMRTLLKQSAEDNFSIWGINSDDTGYAELNQSSWDKYVTALKTFITNRLSKLTTLLAAKNSNNRYLEENTDYKFKANDTKGVNVVINRTAKAGMWNTVCFPFTLSANTSFSLIDYMFGAGTVVEKFNGVTKNSDGSVVLNFEKSNIIDAGVPYLVRPTRDVTVPYAFINGAANLNIDANGLSDAPTTVTKDGYSFIGIFSPTDLTKDGNTGTKLFVGEGGKLLTPSATSGKLKGYRAYFVVPSTGSGAKMLMSFDGTVDGISNVTVDKASTGKIYNINGQFVGTSKEALSKGVYIVNGKKVVIK